MELVFAEHFDQSLRQAPPPVHAHSGSRLDFCCRIWRHPSLRSKKYEGADDLWQARVNRDWRFYFRIIGDKYCLVDITAHPK
jgi:mRNA interferase RelE/StbE